MNLNSPVRVLATIAAACLAAAASVWAEAPSDRPLQVIQTTEPRFPVTTDTITLSSGEARVLINVNAEGKLVDWLVLSYTQPAFAQVAVQAVRDWRYEPAIKDGQPVGVRMALEFTFRAEGKVISTLPVQMYDNFVSSLFGPLTHREVCRAGELDHPLQIVRSVRPKYAGAAWKDGPPAGHVLLDFFVDGTGRPRMPIVIRATDPRFAAAATAALEQWRFSPPLRGGQPVAVQVQQEFDFAD